MTQEEHELRELRRLRIARVKRFMRYLPRRSNMHRYPLLHLFADAARRRHYLWTFRVASVTPTLYVGFVLAFLPLYGVQIPVAALLAFWLRANLPIMVGLQTITNPFTALPIYFSLFKMGRAALGMIGIHPPDLTVHQLRLVLDHFTGGQWGENFVYLLQVFGTTSLGGLILGVFMGGMCAFAYRVMTQRVNASYLRLKELQHAREERLRAEAAEAEKQPNDGSASGQKAVS